MGTVGEKLCRAEKRKTRRSSCTSVVYCHFAVCSMAGQSCNFFSIFLADFPQGGGGVSVALEFVVASFIFE